MPERMFFLYRQAIYTIQMLSEKISWSCDILYSTNTAIANEKFVRDKNTLILIVYTWFFD